MNPADIDAIEAQWHRLGVLMQMTVPDAAEVERQYAACLQAVPTMIAEMRARTASADAAWESVKEVSAMYDELALAVWNAGAQFGLDVDEKGFRREDATVVVSAMRDKLADTLQALGTTAPATVTVLTADDAVHIEYGGEA